MKLPLFMPQETMLAYQGKLTPYAGQIFDEPEEDDETVIDGKTYIFTAFFHEDSRGQGWEIFGWYRADYRYEAAEEACRLYGPKAA